METFYDVVILGAGINGLAAARVLAEQGQLVLVLEKGSIACGASSKSSRLIHGGLRYLEHGEFSLVAEALGDQKYLLDTYPDLVKLRPFYLPVYTRSSRPVWMIRLGLWFYGFFAHHGAKPEPVDIEAFLNQFPDFKAQGLKGVFKYYDGKTDDKALSLQIAKEVKEAGGVVLEGVTIEAIDTEEDITVTFDGKQVQTNLLINATGAWVDETNARFGFPSNYTIEKLSGIHITVNKKLVNEPVILETKTQRIFFMIPEGETTYIGTTERTENGAMDEVKVNDKDVTYLLEESNFYLKTSLSEADIIDTCIGVRPIIKSAKDPSKMSREYKLDLHHMGKNRIMHIYGGKLTTFPSLARRVLKSLF